MGKLIKHNRLIEEKQKTKGNTRFGENKKTAVYQLFFYGLKSRLLMTSAADKSGSTAVEKGGAYVISR